MTYSTAKDIAVETGYKIIEYCDKLNIAGSIRRKKSDVKDIEIVCCPKHEDVLDLFGKKEGALLSPEFSKAVMGLGKVIKGKPHGRYMQIDLGKIKLDLFMPELKDYYRQFAIRTGSDDYSKLIANSWQRLGWCGSDRGLRRISDCVLRGHSDWHCVRDGELPPVWESEQHFFDWLKMNFIKPQNR